MTQTAKILGSVLIGISIILLFILVFVKLDVDKQGAFLCETFHENQLDMEQCPAHKSNVSWLLVTAFGIGFLMLASGIYLLFFFSTSSAEMRKEFKEIDASKLNEEEKKIYEIVKNSKGSAYQTDLIKETGFSKVKMSRILDKMEAKDILERKRRGMTNIIVLK